MLYLKHISILICVLINTLSTGLSMEVQSKLDQRSRCIKCMTGRSLIADILIHDGIVDCDLLPPPGEEYKVYPVFNDVVQQNIRINDIGLEGPVTYSDVHGNQLTKEHHDAWEIARENMDKPYIWQAEC